MTATIFAPEELARRRRKRETARRWPHQSFEGSILDAFAEEDEVEAPVPVQDDSTCMTPAGHIDKPEVA